MSRVQLALNVDDIEQAVAFYTTLFGAEPAKLRPGYANFAVENPPLKLVLFEAKGQGGTLNHLGVEVESTDEVRVAAERFGTPVQDSTDCCYAVQDKVWIGDQANGRWEVYTVLADSHPELEGVTAGAPAACCAPGATTEAATICCG
jgi:catechol 2,3-dioxygenase-like lactoylglutathione lyase family enzyme